MSNRRKGLLALFLIVTNLYSSNACWMQGVTLWALPQGATILDTFRGNIFDREIRDIESIISVVSWEGLNSGPYVTATLTDSRFLLTTNNAYENYEEYETVNSMSVTVNFRCSVGSDVSLMFIIEVEDTNNNAPRFLPSDQLDFTIYTPLPPGSLITGCFDGITVRDIDLTTVRVDFAIEENPYFEIIYDASASNTDKEFIAVLRTTTFIRSLPEPITLVISATDVDLTGDPPLTTMANVVIRADAEFELPEEPVFTQTYYFADYVNDNEIVLLETISLQSGFDELVEFRLEGEYAANFQLIPNGNQLSLSVVTPLSINIIREQHIFLVVRAEREYTSGDSATIVVRLPEEIPLEFERAYYEGTIENNVLQALVLTLTRGYEGATISVQVLGEYSSFFTTNVQENSITLLMEPLSNVIINENNIIILEIVASSEFNSASTIVTLEIIKDDNVTPVFNRPLYEGSYNSDMGLILEEIVFNQGFDDTVELSLKGEHADLFVIRQEGSVFTLTTTTILPEIFSQQRILLTLQATKPRTVGATAAVVISLPAAQQLRFEESNYRGTLQDNALSLAPIVLSEGRIENVVFIISGDYSDYFLLTLTQTGVTISLASIIPDNIILENSLIILTVEASGLNAITTATNILVDIIKEDVTTPVFSRNIYYGTYQGTSNINLEDINLTQGFGDDVIFSLEGDHSQYFGISNTGNNVIVSLTSNIPEELIYTEKVLLFNVVANKPLTVGANAAIVIRFSSELTDPVVMRFSQNTYKATIENDVLTADDIVLSTGYQPGIEFILTGDYVSYFTIIDTNNFISILMANPLPISEIENSFIVLELEARRERAISTWTSIVIELVKEEVQAPVFTNPYYQGTYNEELGTLSIEEIALSSGYDDTVTFELEGDHSQYFGISNTGNNVIVSLTSSIPEEVIFNEKVLLFNVVANKPLTVGANAAIVIRFSSELTDPVVMRFSQNTYKATVENDVLTADDIVLSTGYQPGTDFILTGDYVSYFTIIDTNNVVSLSIVNPLPISEIENSFVLLELEARRERAISTWTSIVIELVKEEVQAPVFTNPYYQGTYNQELGTLSIEEIALASGYDDTVTFELEGDHSQYFGISNTGNNVIVSLTSSIPEELIFNEKVLLFNVVANKPLTVGANAAIVIRFSTDLTDPVVMRFSQNTYKATVENNILTADDIVLSTGYQPGTDFILTGDYVSYFTIVDTNNVVSLSMVNSLPISEIENSFILLELEARRERAISTWTSIVIDLVKEEVQALVFTNPYYQGIYNEELSTLSIEEIVLASGYDDTVTFELEGDLASWFTIVDSSINSASIVLMAPIPSDVLQNINHILFSISAAKPNANDVHAAISIIVEREIPDVLNLEFDRVTYVGSIENTVITLDPITLIEGYTNEVTFSLHGDLASYFTLLSQGTGVVIVTLPQPIPDQMIPANRLIVLDIRASAPQAQAAHATIVFEVILEDDLPAVPQLIFDATYYTGTYTEPAGVTLDTPISLAQGYDQTVEFALEGDHAQWFGVVINGNSVSLTTISTIPSAVLANNPQLVFVITAQRLGSDTARATIVITITDEVTEGLVLGFDRVTYVGSIENTLITLDPITLIEGYTNEVTFSLHGDLASYFTLLSQGAGVVIVTLPQPIPDQMIPANCLIVLDIRASAPQAQAAHATIVFEVILEDDLPAVPQLIFDATYYTGTYTEPAGVTLDTPISLAQGYDQTVEFALEGDHAQWFGVVINGNSVSLTTISTIPSAVLANNPQLVFVITAQRLGSDTARATIVITITDEVTEGLVLGFDRVTYVGSIENTLITLDPITLIEGYTNEVTFSLHGDLASYFTLLSQGAGVVIVTLPQPIPDQMIPANRLIVLDIRASAPQAQAAHATIVFEVILEDDLPAVPQLIFDATYYTGTYTEPAGVTLDTPISLAQGYDQTVEFALEGDHAQWFGAVINGNSVSLTTISTIPSAVLANNPQLVFVITAQRLGRDTARATIVITITDEVTEGLVLGFDRVTYVGSIENTLITLDPITLIEGYTNEVTFSLHGDLASYFTLLSQGAGVVIVTLPQPIPDQIIPANRLIVLDIRASAPQAQAAHATIVFEVILEDDLPAVPQLIFDATYYTGTYTEPAGVTLDTPISLAQGYDQTVEFALEGDHAQWFGVVINGNSVSLTTISTIPSAVLANNPQLVFVITAQRLGRDTARATIVITITDEVTEGLVLGFDRVTYVGSIENTLITLDPITLIEGYTNEVTFSLHGDLASYFTLLSQGAGVVIVTLPQPIPDQMIPANRLIVLDIRASAPQAQAAHATIVFEVILEDDLPAVPQLIFDATYYTGTYTEPAGVTLDTPISLAQGYDQTVEFALEGDHAQWFGVVINGNSVSLTTISTIPSAVLANNPQLVFVITAQRLGSDTARATIVITITDEVTEGLVLGFDRVTYVGSIENTLITLDPITLIEGYTNEVTFSLHGDLASYFTLLSQGAGVVIVTLPQPIPDQMIPANRLIVLDIRASAPQAQAAHATIVFEVILEDDLPAVPQLIFDATYYTGTYTEPAGVTLDTPISLAQGYDQTVEFALEGDHAQWFGVVINGNSVSLTTISTIPSAVLANNPQLVFVITAQRLGSDTARATIVITITNEVTEGLVLGFDRVTYVGSIENTLITLDSITLIEGYTNEVTFSLHGDLASYFTLLSQGAGVVIVTLPQPIPDQMIPANRLIVLDIRASAPQAQAAHATIVFEVILEDDLPAVPQLIFDATYYTGTYTEPAGVTLDTPISLAQGYDQTVEFALEGDHAQWFGVVINGNSVSLTTISTIPSAVLANNPQLVFVITAQRLESDTARATIVITITDEVTEGLVLGFDRVTYVGSIENTLITLDPITLIEGYTNEVTFSLHGDLASYFTLLSQGAGVVIVTLPQPIPDQMIPANRLIVLDIRASAPQAQAAHATIVFEVILEDDLPAVPQLIFDATYYTGTYTEPAGVTLDTPISLAQGYDQTVEFALEGDHAQWFGVVINGNSVSLTTISIIPSAVLANNPQLVFVITAQRLGSDTARATIVITITDEVTEGLVLGFDRVTYVGSIENTLITLDPITLIEGYTNEVTFSLHGDLASYFTLLSQGAGVVIVTLPQPIPDQMIPANRLIVLDIRASAPQAQAAHATIVFEVILEDDLPAVPQLIFDATYYTGTYTEPAGVTLDTPISLAQGYDQTVEFALEGDHAQWFGAVINGNSVSLTTISTIPSAVLANNPQLVFVITAQRLGRDTARATIVITITDEVTEGLVLGFDRVTYVGSIENTLITLDPITLIEGYTNEVTFSLHGDLASYFTLLSQGAGVVIVTLPQPIPDQIIPANRLIVLDIRASAPQAQAAHATIVFEVILEDDLPAVPQLIFDATYYTGTYTEPAGVTLDTPISLAQGYDQTVEFALEGDHAQWFGVVINGNSVSLTTISTIPSAVLANNPQLVFVITAQRLGRDTARATIVITITDEVTEGLVLGFDRVTYVGSIENTLITLDPITLIEGYTNEVTFSLHGDLASYFTLLSQGAGVVIVTLPQPIPDQMIPANRLIVLDIRASAPQAQAAHATIVFEVILEDDLPAVPQLIFDATYYTGTYTEPAGVTLDTPISLAQGYDQTVEFALEGDHAQWFGVVINGNSVSLTTISTIPSAVLANNPQLVFVITAQRLGSDTARATIVITITDEVTEGLVLGFDRVTYVGSIENTLITLDPITLIEGYTNEVTFSLHGDLASYFTLLSQGAGVVIVTLPQPIPDQMIPANRLIVLDIRASAPQAQAAHATIVFEVILEDDLPAVPQLIFDATYYTGTYTEPAGVTLDTPISLAQGYDQTVEFALEGDHAQWFGVVINGNSVSLTTISTIPSTVLANNPQLVFVITAQRLGSDTARATIVITITNEVTEGLVLGFDRVTYVGSIENTLITLDSITLIEGYTNEVTFSLHGDLASYFTLLSQGAGVVIVTLPQPIPDQMIPANRLIVLDIRASAPQAQAAHATIVFEVILEDDLPAVPQLIFDATYYTGTYTEPAGVTLDTPISLAQGYDQTVEFALEGDHAQWFGVVINGNSVSLTTISTIPSAVLANNPQLVFVITAQRLESDTARATIVITITDEVTEGLVLGFDRVTYVGSIENTLITLDPITLIEGYTNEVTFSLHGDLASYFTLLSQGAGVVIVTLPQPIPDQMIPANRLIVLDIRASAPQAQAAHATIVFEVILEDDLPAVPQLIFDATYYTGTYTEPAGVTLDTPISLAQGYDQTVEFALEGDHAQWFGVVINGNSVSLTTISIIPSAVLANNPQLVFVITAQRLGSDTARATIVITITDEVTEGLVLGFDRVTYVGSIENTLITLDPITLIEGYTNEVTFSLHGDLASYFTLLSQGAGVVIVTLPQPIPDQMIPANRLIVLDIRASAPQAQAAHATIVFEVILEDDLPAVPQLIFDATYYTGTYTEPAGVTLDTPISLAQGYDQTVEFALEGDHAQWFGAVINGNSVSLTTISTIPSAVLANNPQLVFVITAQRLGRDTARATIVITITDEVTEGLVLGFDRVTYVGSIENTLITLDPITLIEGYTNEVTFSLHGDLASYFTLLSQGAGVVIVTLPQPIPDQIIPANRLIVLDIRASAPQAQAAHATIVFEVILEDDLPAVPQLIFDATYYTGTYTEPAGVTLDTPISLAQGYDQTVEFALEGDHAQWFGVVINGNSVSLTTISTIPSAVLANNPQLVFVITAQRLGRDTARATIVITITDEVTEGLVLGFDRVTYVGSIENTLITLDPITLIEGYTNEVTFSLHGDLASYFTLLSQGAGVVIVTLPQPIPDQMIPANRLIVLDIRASAPQAQAAHATIVFEVILEDDLPAVPQLIFDATYYTGTYTEPAGVTLDTPISLAQGYDQTVEFALEGDHAQWFGVVINGNSVSLTTISTIPSAVLANNPQLVFVITAQRLGSDTARATIVITITDEVTEGLVLGFDRVTYVGSIENTLITLDPITLIEGYTNEVTFSLHGDLASYFTLLSQGAGVVIVTLPQPIPDQMIPANRLIVLDIRASAPQAQAAHATIVFEVILEDDLPAVPQLIFDATYYTGTYTEPAGVTLDTPISLAQGYDQTVEFALEGDHAQWFGVVINGNSVSLTTISTIPSAVLANNPQLVFVITAQRLGSDTARATIVITITNEVTEGLVLGFDRVTYVGSIENTLITLDPITLIEGYTNEVTFSLHGDLASYFTLLSQGAGVVIVTLPQPIPDQMIPANRLIVLDIRASAPQAQAAHATIVFEVILEDDLPAVPQLIFDATYYTGTYTEPAGVTLDTPISLAQGYDQTVEFALEGDHAQWFGVVINGNSVSLTTISTIPSAVLANNPQLVFVITAQRLGSDTARATIVITITDEVTEGLVLGFDRVTYVGSIENTLITLDPITLIEGYTNEVTFSLHGDLASYFTLLSQGAGVVIVTLPQPIPDQMIPANRLIVLDIRASAPQAQAAHATIVFEVILEDDLPAVPQLIFDATYYTGTYTEPAGVTLDTPISLAQGYDQTVEFALEGDHAQWFGVVINGNSVSLTTISTIPSAVLANNPQLVFVITAQRLGSDTARATIVITITNEVTEGLVLGFDRVTYVGSIENTLITLDPITLIEGYTNEVTFSLHGDLASYFTLLSQGAGVVIVTLPQPIPDQMIPANHLIVLDIRASAPQAQAAHATIVFEVILEDDLPAVPQLIFDATYYTGTYTEPAGVTLDTPISLAQGYDQTVEFALEGDHAQWFGVVINGNSVSLTTISTIPSAVLANNPQLVFVITAQRLGSDTARATIVITITDEVTEGLVLGFDRVTYVGSIENTLITLDPITLIEGYTNEVTFSLHGDLASYFTLLSQGAGVVIVTLPQPIPDQMIPANRLIVLDIRASAPQAQAAHATIVFEVILEDDLPAVPQLIFDATYYTGTYTEPAGVTLDTPISLAQGYDQTVEFALEGDHAQWFGVVINGNSVSLTTISTIPSAVLANNPQLVFVITAQRLGSDTARATIVITITNEVTEGLVLGFDRVTYVGSIENTLITLDPITLIEGYTNEVTFSLHGDLASYFTLLSQGAGVVIVTLPQPIPDQMIPANRLIVLDIRASAPQAQAAHATIVFEVILEDDLPAVPQPIFDATYYTGTYTEPAGVTLDTPISLAQGYDQTVEFALEGDHAQWFGVVINGNSVSLTTISTIPSAVLANNPQLVFVITAQRLGSDTARATIVITITNDLQTEEDVLFDKLVYEGIIQIGNVQHEVITIINYEGVTIQLHGEYSSLFVARMTDGVVAVQASGSLNLPDDVTHVVLELHAADARAVLLLSVIETDDSSLPSVTFSSSSYVLNVEIVQTGLVGRVHATADNGESITYSLSIDNTHLQTRISINNEGELYLSAPANSGVYTFQVIATTVITRAEGTAMVYLTAEAVTVCGDNEIVVPPLIILDRDEEESHSNLVTLNTNQYESCHFTLSNRWPHNQDWLYVDETGLHSRSIDREHESIAFMALSQIQVELILHCENDAAVRSKRSVRSDWLGPYDYGTSTWILTESIPYNSRRSLVNLIVNDINDNYPIFIGKELEPITVGYPIKELEERILPRSLAELQATDADIGDNAALTYWSSEDVLAVEGTTGFVHVRSGAQLENNQILTVRATDQNGQGLTGDIQLMVKLLDLNNILVITVRDAFLNDENQIMAQLSQAVGYELKTLRSVVISDDLIDEEDILSRQERNTQQTSLLLYVYGLIEREPVFVERLSMDINTNAVIVNIINTISLEDYIELEVMVERDTGFMIATIVLSILLFIIIVLIGVWLFIRWRRNRNYDKFSDENSLASRGESVEQLPKPNTVMPRLNIEELIKSEKRLQDMLSAPVEGVSVEPVTPKKEVPIESVIDLSSPEHSTPIVIQSIDKLKNSDDTDEDEFGESSGSRRKSVVTFNENVEKIIHVEDNGDDEDTVSSQGSYEIYKL